MTLRGHVMTVGRSELGDCLAASTLAEDGEVRLVLNGDYFPALTKAEKRFVVAHELGHVLLCTDSEYEADAFALGLTAGRAPQSLKRAVSAIARMQAVPAARVRRLLHLCQAVDKIQQSNTKTDRQ